MADTETGPGVFETALGYTDAARMADNAILFKFVAKTVGMKYGITPTFMAKPYSDVRRPPPLVLCDHSADRGRCRDALGETGSG